MNLKFNILQRTHRPVVKYENMLLLFDTGASTPVWCQGIDTFKDRFSKSGKMDYKFLLTGFGRSEAELVNFLKKPYNAEINNYFADVYSVPSFSLKTAEGCITWKNLNIAVTNREFSGVHIILPYTMFGGMEISFNQERAFPQIRIESPSDTKYTFIKLNNNFNEKILQYIYSQNEEVLYKIP
ncbi:MAG: hypothetical protein OSJ45_08625 [Lachnospiraceae bacterium]|nr:hypothetical protein [Lachnospiraceae bacterium]